MTNQDLIENCIAAYVGAAQSAEGQHGSGQPGAQQHVDPGFGSAAKRAMFGYTAAAHRLTVTALPPSRPTRMPPQSFEFPGLPVLGAVRRVFRPQAADMRPAAETASH